MAPTTTEILAALVGFDTTSRNSNLALIGWVRAYLDHLVVGCRITTDATGGKANLHAIIGPRTEGGVALSGHVNTMPVDSQALSTDPFSLPSHDGRLQDRDGGGMNAFEAARHDGDLVAGFTFEVLNDGPALSLDPAHELTGLVRQLTGSNSPRRVSHGAEAGVFQSAGVPTIICGAGGIDQAHQPGKWIAASEIAACDDSVRCLAARMAA